VERWYGSRTVVSYLVSGTKRGLLTCDRAKKQNHEAGGAKIMALHVDVRHLHWVRYAP
jgi:hypothetical protein